jgi:DNA-binding transcriptional LysR family regulator
MTISLRQLEAFVAVCEEGSFSKAASRVNISQSGLSVLIRQLESVLGVRLFDRSTRHVLQTRAGEEFRAPCMRLLADLSRAVGNVKALEARQRGHVVVAAPPLLAARLLVSMAKVFRSEFPNITLGLLDIPADAIVQGVRAGTIDIGFGAFAGAASELMIEPLVRGPLMALFPKTHALAGKRTISLKQIATSGLVIQARGNPFRADLDRSFLRMGIEPVVNMEVTQLSTVISLVESGFGAAIMPPYAALLSTHPKTLTRPISEPALVSEIVMISDALREPSAASKAFREIAQRMVSKTAGKAQNF